MLHTANKITWNDCRLSSFNVKHVTRQGDSLSALELEAIIRRSKWFGNIKQIKKKDSTNNIQCPRTNKCKDLEMQ